MVTKLFSAESWWPLKKLFFEVIGFINQNMVGEDLRHAYTAIFQLVFRVSFFNESLAPSPGS